jgi:glutathione S-transferase
MLRAMDYVDAERAMGMRGLRLALTEGVPGPWSESAKYLFQVKRVPYTPVRQVLGEPNESLRRWTGHANAPIAVYDDEAPRTQWAEILALAERLGSGPSLIPEDPELRLRMFGLATEICGQQGFGWQRRLMLLAQLGTGTDTTRTLGDRYGYQPAAVAAAPARAAEILTLLSAQLRAQRARGSRYFVGDALTALDLYWAAFAAMLEPLPDDVCKMPGYVRAIYPLREPDVRAAADPMLLEHRDFIYQKFLTLPLDF